MFTSCRNNLIDLLWKSMVWFVDDVDFGLKFINTVKTRLLSHIFEFMFM